MFNAGFPCGFRGGLQLSDISENPNNDRIGGDPPTHPPNPNKCLMLDISVVLHIPGVHWYSIRFIKVEEKERSITDSRTQQRQMRKKPCFDSCIASCVRACVATV